MGTSGFEKLRDSLANNQYKIRCDFFCLWVLAFFLLNLPILLQVQKVS